MVRPITLLIARSAVLFFAVVAVMGCTGSVHRSNPVNLASTREFGFRLFRQLASTSKADNIAFSPVCAGLCLAVAANGAAGRTRSEIAGLLGTSATSLDSINEANAAMMGTLARASGHAELTMATSIWGITGLEFTKSFLDVCSLDYYASARTLDFANPNAVREINDWVADKTHNLIPTIVDSIDSSGVALILSAVYFRRAWASQFDPARTSARPFYLMNSDRVERRLMMQDGTFWHLKTDSFSAVALPFADYRCCMYVFVPRDRDGLTGFMRNLSDADWRRWRNGFCTGRVRVGLPKFRVQYETSLKASLMALGMKTAFGRGWADFTPMVVRSPLRPIWLGDVAHKVFVEIDEQGATAAASTGQVVFGGPIQTDTIMADHPFFYAIEDNWSGAILFMGAVYDPPQ